MMNAGSTPSTLSVVVGDWPLGGVVSTGHSTDDVEKWLRERWSGNRVQAKAARIVAAYLDPKVGIEP
jgi:hypothetical protein